MARGSIAKDLVFNKIAQAFGEDFVGIVDNKAYVWAKENGERLQIAIALTCPKTMVQPEGKPVTTGDLDFGGGLDFEAMGTGKVIQTQKAEDSKEEQETIAALMKKLGLI